MKYPIEIKLHYDKTTIPNGIEQLSGYMNSLGCKKGWLVVFNRDQDLSWDEKIFWKDVSEKGLQIGVAWC